MRILLLSRCVLSAAIFCILLAPSHGAEPPATTFCNPLNLDYQPFGKSARTGADPVIIPFQGKYYLFDSQYRGGIVGYRVSEDLIHWRRIPFGMAVAPLVLVKDDEGYASRRGGQRRLDLFLHAGQPQHPAHENPG